MHIYIYVDIDSHDIPNTKYESMEQGHQNQNKGPRTRALELAGSWNMTVLRLETEGKKIISKNHADCMFQPFWNLL